MEDSRIWFKLGTGLYASFLASNPPGHPVELVVENSRIQVNIRGLGVKECSIATQPRVLVPGTQKWSLEDYLFVESAAGSASEALYLVTQFLDERQGDGFFLIPAVRGVSYAITCGSESRRIVQRELFIEAPGSCEFVFTSRPRSLSVEVVDTRGHRLTSMSGYGGMTELDGRSDVFRRFEGGFFQVPQGSVVNKSHDSTLSLLVALSDGEFFSRSVPREDWKNGRVTLVKGAGYPADVIKMPTGDPPPRNGPIQGQVGVWAYVKGKPVEGMPIINAPAIPASDANFFFMRKGKDLLVINLNSDWTEMWFQSESGNLASVIRGDDRLRWKPTYVLKGIDWSVMQKARGARIFRASLQYKFATGAHWMLIQSWDLIKTPTPELRLIKGVPYRVVLNRNNVQTIILQG